MYDNGPTLSTKRTVDPGATIVHTGNMSQPALINTRTAAVILHTSTRTVARLVERRQLTPVATVSGGPNGVHVFDRADVEALATARQAAR